MSLQRAIGRAILRELAPQGLPANQVIRIAQGYGGSYRRQDMLTDYRKFADRMKYQARVQALPFDGAVPKSWMVQTELQQPTKYRVFGSATIYDWETDQAFTKTVSFYTDEWKTTGEYGVDFQDHFQMGYEDENLEVIEFQQIAMEHDVRRDY